MNETPLFFPNGGYSLFGVLHQPEVPTSMPAFVFCHPFGEEKLWTHRVFVSFARRLAAAGYPVLRFDYMGHGDSGGDFSDASLSTARSDVRCAVEYVRHATKAPAVCLLGLRWGATVASLVAEDLPDLKHLILWTPVVNGAAYMQDLLRNNLTTQMATYKEIRQDRVDLVAQMEQGLTVNVDGYEISLPMYAEVSAVKLADAPKSHGGPCLITQIDPQPGKPAKDLHSLAATYSSATVLFAREDPFWKEIPRWYKDAPNLYDVTLDWLKTR